MLKFLCDIVSWTVVDILGWKDEKLVKRTFVWRLGFLCRLVSFEKAEISNFHFLTKWNGVLVKSVYFLGVARRSENELCVMMKSAYLMYKLLIRMIHFERELELFLI